MFIITSLDVVCYFLCATCDKVSTSEAKSLMLNGKLVVSQNLSVATVVFNP